MELAIVTEQRYGDVRAETGWIVKGILLDNGAETRTEELSFGRYLTLDEAEDIQNSFQSEDNALYWEGRFTDAAERLDQLLHHRNALRAVGKL